MRDYVKPLDYHTVRNFGSDDAQCVRARKCRRISIWWGSFAVLSPILSVPLFLVIGWSIPREGNLGDLFIGLVAAIYAICIATLIGVILSIITMAVSAKKPVGTAPLVLALIAFVFNGGILLIVILWILFGSKRF
jgi:hypothetical protein